MSSSDGSGSNVPASGWGTIFSQGGEHSLGGIEREHSTRWTHEDESAYLDRVRGKATALAVSLLDEARAEAARIRESAREEGYNQGLAEAQTELDTFRSGMADSVSAVLSAIEGQCSSIFGQWREELTAVTRLAVEKGTAMQLSEERSAMLGTLLEQAVDILEQRRELVIRVNPEDEPVLADIIGLTREKYPDVKAWRVRGDASVAPGGMVVESESSLAEGRVESRIAAVEEVLSRLMLPGTP